MQPDLHLIGRLLHRVCHLLHDRLPVARVFVEENEETSEPGSAPLEHLRVERRLNALHGSRRSHWMQGIHSAPPPKARDRRKLSDALVIT